LESGQNSTYKVTNLEEENLYDPYMGDWNMSQTDIVIWAEDKYPQAIRESFQIQNSNQDVDTWLNN